MDMNQNESGESIEKRIDQKLREAEIPGHEVEFDPDEADRIAFREDALSDEDARESIIDL
jgi:hypothetical protein